MSYSSSKSNLMEKKWLTQVSKGGVIKKNYG